MINLSYAKWKEPTKRKKKNPAEAGGVSAETDRAEVFGRIGSSCVSRHPLKGTIVDSVILTAKPTRLPSCRSTRRICPLHFRIILPRALLSSIENLVDSPIAKVPLIQKYTPEALMSRVTPMALFRNTRIPVLARWFLLLFDGFVSNFRTSGWRVKFALDQACRSGMCECDS